MSGDTVADEGTYVLSCALAVSMLEVGGEMNVVTPTLVV